MLPRKGSEKDARSTSGIEKGTYGMGHTMTKKKQSRRTKGLYFDGLRKCCYSDNEGFLFPSTPLSWRRIVWEFHGDEANTRERGYG